MNRFVLHRHLSRHPHYDLRLERDGVLKSWAVPKGLSQSPGVKRLAVEVPDHPLDYIGFEGTIPEGEYGAGTVEVWDAGPYSVGSWEKDKVVFELKGKKFSGPYALVRTAGKNWIIFRTVGGAR